MKKIKIPTKIILSLFIMIIVIGIHLTAKAANIVSTDKTVESGGNVSITITSKQTLGSYKIAITNLGGLTLTSASGGEISSDKKTITGSSSSGITTLGTYTFSTPNVNVDTKYYVNFSITSMETVNLDSVADENNVAVVTVKAKTVETTPSTDNSSSSNSGSTSGTTTTKSSVATLANLGISGQYDFSGFKAATTSYSQTVPNSVTSVSVYATKGQSAQKIDGIGTHNLNVGENKIDVKVTAEDGTTKTYTINVTRKAEQTTDTTETPTDETEEKEDATETGVTLEEEIILGLSKLEIEGYKLNQEFKTDVYEYIITVSEDINLEDLKITAEPSFVGAKVETSYDEDENIITIMVTDETGDKVVTYQITVTQENKEAVIATSNNTSNIKKQIIIIGAIVVVIIVIIIILIIKYKKGAQSAFSTEDIPYYNINSKKDTMDEEEYEQIDNMGSVVKPEETDTEFGDIFEDSEDEFPPKKKNKGKRFK